MGFANAANVNVMIYYVMIHYGISIFFYSNNEK